jgi:hypothetical protein
VKPVVIVSKIDSLKKDSYDLFKSTSFGMCPLKPPILSFCVEFNFINSL